VAQEIRRREHLKDVTLVALTGRLRRARDQATRPGADRIHPRAARCRL